MTGPPDEVVTTRIVLGVEDVDGEPRATRQVIEVIDRGTGSGASFAALGLDAHEADEVLEHELRSGRLRPLGSGTEEHRVSIEMDAGEGGKICASVTGLEARSPGAPGQVGAGVRVEARRGQGTRHFTFAELDLVDRVLGAMTRLRLDAAGGVTLHGSAAVDDDGQTVVALASSGSGKSTLVAHLVASGMRLLNDEQITLHPRAGLIGGFTRPVAVKPGGASYLPGGAAAAFDGADATVLVPAAALGGRHALTGIPSLVVLPQRRDEVEPGWDVLDPLAAVEALAANNLDLVVDPMAGFEAYSWLATAATVVRLYYRTSAEGAVTVQRLLSELAREPAQLEPVSLGVTVAAGSTREPTPRLAVRPGVVTVAGPDGGLLFDPDSLAMVSLNPAAVAALSSLPLPRWPTDPNVRGFLARLVDDGVVEESTPSPGRPSLVVLGGLGSIASDIGSDLGAVLAGLSRSGSTADVDHGGDRGGGGVLLLDPRGPELGRALDAQGLDVHQRSPGSERWKRAAWRAAGPGGPQTVVLPLESACGSVLRVLGAGHAMTLVMVHPSEWPPVVPRRLRLALRWLSRRHRVRVLITGGASTTSVAEVLGLSSSLVVGLPVTAPELPVQDRAGDGAALREAFGVPPDHLVVVTFADDLSEGDVITVMSVAKAARSQGLDARFLVLGRGPVLDLARERAEDPGLDGSVTVVAQPEVIEGFLLGADVHLLTRPGRDGRRLVVRAMHAGLPTVAWGVGSAATIVRGGGGGRWVSSSDPAALALALAQLAGDRAERHRLGLKAVEVARADHGERSVEAVVARLGGRRRRGGDTSDSLR